MEQSGKGKRNQLSKAELLLTKKKNAEKEGCFNYKMPCLAGG